MLRRALLAGIVAWGAATPVGVRAQVDPVPGPEETPLVQTQVTTQGAPSGDDDRTAFLIGSWRCQTYQGTTMTHVFSRARNGASIHVETRAILPDGTTAGLHEDYAYHAGGFWTADVDNDALEASSHGWTGPTWTFAGISNESHQSAVSMTFSILGPDHYHRDFKRTESGQLTTYAGEDCHRQSP